MGIASLGARVRGWWRRQRLRSAAQHALRGLFASASDLASTSLRPAHLGRIQIVEVIGAGRSVESIIFSILRHPRPYPFSSQYHEVIEWYRYQPAGRRLERLRSINVSRAAGQDGKPGSKS